MIFYDSLYTELKSLGRGAANYWPHKWSLSSLSSCNPLVTDWKKAFALFFLNPLLLFGELPSLGWPSIWLGTIMAVSSSTGCFLFLYRALTTFHVLVLAYCFFFIKWSKGKFWKVWCALVPICRPTINSPAAYACSCLIGNCSAFSQCCGVSVKGGKETCEWWVSCIK